VRKQLRRFWTRDELPQVYSKTYDHSRWHEHVERVKKTAEVLDIFAEATESCTVADLSCGDGGVLRASNHPWERVITGDFTTTGPIEEAIKTLEPVDMFILSETLEHIVDPDTLLKDIRRVAKNLVLTTPHGEDTDENLEHYWGWDTVGIGEMFSEADWNPVSCDLFTPNSCSYYTFQIWTCC
jgi:hypothetical protein